MNFPRLSQIRFPKLIVHALLLIFILTIMSIITQGLIKRIFNLNFAQVDGPASTLVLIWMFFAVQNKKYQKDV